MAQGIEHHNSTVKCHAHSWNITNELDTLQTTTPIMKYCATYGKKLKSTNQSFSSKYESRNASRVTDVNANN